MSSTFYTVGIDPGSSTGVAIFELDCHTFDIMTVNTFVVVLNNFISGEENILIARNIILKMVCDDISRRYRPNVVSIESAFLNSRFPKAIMQLSQYLTTIEQSFYVYNNFVKIHKYAPKYVKKYIGAGGNANKDNMVTAITKISELSNLVDLYRLTEHEVDAIAIGYIAIEHIRKYPHTLISY